MQWGFAVSELCCSHGLLEGKCVITWLPRIRAINFMGALRKQHVYVNGATRVTNNNNIAEKISSLDV